MTYDVGGIYIVWLSDTHFYGGRSKRVHNRCAGHAYMLREGKHHNTHCQSVWNIHHTFRYEVIQRADTIEEQVRLEQVWLNENVKKPGCLNTSRRSEGGGNTGKRLSSEWKKNISESLKGRALSEQHKRKLREGRLGMVFSEEHRKNIGIASTGRKMPAHCGEATSKRLLGVPLSPERVSALRLRKHTEASKKKMSEAGKGKTFTVEHRHKLSQAAKARCERTALAKKEKGT